MEFVQFTERKAITIAFAPGDDEQSAPQKEIKVLESQRRRQQIFEVEDEIETRRDALIEASERRLHQHSRNHQLFRIRWKLV
jgi:hypothetical protein